MTQKRNLIKGSFSKKVHLNLKSGTEKNQTHLAVLVPHRSMIPAQDFAVENGIIVVRFAPSHGSTYFDGGRQRQRSLVERVRVGTTDENGLRLTLAIAADQLAVVVGVDRLAVGDHHARRQLSQLDAIVSGSRRRRRARLGTSTVWLERSGI